MKLARLLVAGVGLVLTLGGYAASQFAFFQGSTARYIQALDSSPVPIISLVLLAAAVILAFIPDREEEG